MTTTAAAQTDLRALLALGQARRPWEFIRAVAEAGPGIAGVPPIRFLLAANVGSLGFADLAIEEVDAVDASGTPGLNTADLRSGLASRPRTAVPVQTLRETAEHNLALLGLNRTCADTPPVWMTDTGACAWRDGVVIAGCDARAHAAAVLKRSHLATDRVPSDHLPPLLIAGLSTPHLLQGALRATRPLTNGYTPRVFIVEPDEQRATRALSMLRLDENLEGDPVSERLSLFVGEGAIGSLGEALGSTIDCSLPRSVMLDGLAPKSLAESVQQVLGYLHERQREAIDHEAARIERETQTLDGAVARVRNGEQLRVLIPVSRHTNFVRHSASDLAEALRSLGHQPTILTEPEPHRVLSRLGYLRAWAETNPDLVLTINHPRWRTSSALPERAVSVCWVQDAMPHLFEDAASKQGDHDFIVGYRFHELTERFSYRADRVIDAVLPVSTTKFHGGPVDDALRERFACDVAFATRQSETPEAMRDRLRAEPGASPGMGAVIDHLDETLRGRIGAGAFSFTLKESHELAREALQRAGHTKANHKAVDEIYRVVLMPLADRIVRHLVAHRTASICERRGWSFALYGSGWENHPTLARHARGELLHGEELRAAYRCAGVHLHASAHSLIHQRSIECLFSGGRVLAHRRPCDASVIRRHTFGTLLRTSTPDRIDDDGSHAYTIDSHPQLRDYIGTLKQIGVSDPWHVGGEIRIPGARIEPLEQMSSGSIESALARLTHLVLDGHSFGDRDSLEASLEAVLSDASPPDESPVRTAARDHYAIDQVVARMLGSLRDSLDGAAE